MTATRRWVIGTAIAVVVILAAGYLLLVKPQKHKVSSLKDQASAQLQANQLLLTQISALQAEQKQLPQQQLVLQKFAAEIPDTASEPTLIRALTETAKGAGVDLSAITPGTPTQVSAAATPGQSLGAAPAGGGGPLYSLPLSLTVNGGYSNIESFFSGLEHLPRAFLVSSFNLGPGGANAGSTTGAVANELTASISTAVFYATQPAAAPAPAAAAGAPAPAGGTAPTPAPTTGGVANPAAPAASAAGNAAGAPPS
ncbi:MAG: type 4a pilus biogenesis protein PilO [Mycobacteriales bacterium]